MRHECRMPDGCLVVVGYDPPLETYFAQVYLPEPEGPCKDPECPLLEDGEHDRADCEEDSIITWIGVDPADKITSVEDLAQRLDPPEGPATGYGSWVLSLKRTLELDRMTAPPPSPLQRGMRSLFEE